MAEESDGDKILQTKYAGNPPDAGTLYMKERTTWKGAKVVAHLPVDLASNPGRLTQKGVTFLLEAFSIKGAPLNREEVRRIFDELQKGATIDPD